MKYLIIILLLPLAAFSQHVRKIDVKSFRPDPIQLSFEPDFDLLMLRHDIIRRSKTVEVNDSVSEDVALDHHLMGFSVGPYIFIDLNKNITIQIDKLLGISMHENFVVKKSYYPHRKGNTVTYRFENGVFSTKMRQRGKTRQRFSIDQSGNQFDLYHKKRFLFSVVKNEEGLFQKRRKRYTEKIFWHGNQHYTTTSKPNRGNKFYMKDGQINIDKTYLIKTNSTEDAIEVYSWRRHNLKRPLYTIQHNQSEIIFYDRHRRGYYISYSPDEVKIYHRNKLMVHYVRED